MPRAAAKIRPARAADKVAWQAMREALWPDEDGLGDELEALPKKKDFQAWMAVAGGRLVGFAEAGLRAYANGCESQPVSFLEAIWVDPAYRRRGLGRALVKAAEAWSKRRGIYELGSDTWLWNRRSQAAHGKWGFEETERVVYYRKKLR